MLSKAISLLTQKCLPAKWYPVQTRSCTKFKMTIIILWLSNEMQASEIAIQLVKMG